MAITPFATDEHIAIRDGGDYTRLCPDDQRYASALDGAIAAMSWTLTSATLGDFAARGIQAGQMVWLKQAGIKAGNDLLVVDSVETTNLVLRRKGQPSGVGMPPGGVAGLTAIDFEVLTLGPQVEDVSYALYRRYGLDDAIPGRESSDLYDVRELRQLCVLKVLRRQYLAMARRGTPDDAFWVKARELEGEISDLDARLVLHFKPLNGLPSDGPTGEALGPFSTRISR